MPFGSSLNLVWGSALSSIGLTIPTVAVTTVVAGRPLELGLEPKDLVMLVLTYLVASSTLVSGRTHVLPGAVHLVIFAAFLYLGLPFASSSTGSARGTRAAGSEISLGSLSFRA
jgi:Ca2+:H+ antiporter